jgi:hypothetical protein
VFVRERIGSRSVFGHKTRFSKVASTVKYLILSEAFHADVKVLYARHTKCI